MGDSWETAGAPAPEGVASLDELIERLQSLRIWSGVSYRELHRRLVRRRRARNIPEEPVYATVYRCFQTGRRRIDIDLVAEIVAELTGDDAQATRWRQAHTRLDGATRPSPAHTNVLDRLPDDLPTFTGRQPELDLILDHASRGHGIIAIEGMAGVGKTTLAVRAAHEILKRDDRIDVVLTVNLHGHDPDQSPADPAAVLDAFLRQLGEPGPRVESLDLLQRSTRLRELLAAQASVVLLDNAASAEQVEPLLPESSKSAVLVTSRRRVVRRALARHLTLEVFTPEQAVGLLRSRCGEVVEVASDVSRRIVGQVGYLPLAVALVAARIESTPDWTLQDHLDQLVERREVLRLDRGVELAFATSYEALPRSLQRLLRFLALHPGRSCDSHAAAALADIDVGDVDQQLASLRAASLVTAQVPGRYELHDLVRIFALSRAREEDAPSVRRTALKRLSDHYRSAATAAMDVYAPEERQRREQANRPASPIPTVTDRASAIAWLEDERPNLVAMAAKAAEHGWEDDVGDLSATLAPYLRNTVHYEEAESLHRFASTMGSAQSRAVALKNLAVIRWFRGHRSEGMQLLQDALRLASRTGDHSTQARILNNLGSAHYQSSHFAESLETYQQALTEYRKSDDPVGEAKAMFNLANALVVVGRYGEALERYEQSLALSRTADSRSTEARILENLGRLYNRLERYDDARRALRRGITVAQEVGDRVGEAEARSRLGTTYARTGHTELALRLQHRALSDVVEHGNLEAEIDLRVALSDTLCRLERGSDALTHAHRALTMATDLDDTYRQAAAHKAAAEAHGLLGDGDAARGHHRQALTRFARLGTPEAAAVRAQLADLKRDEPNDVTGPEMG